MAGWSMDADEDGVDSSKSGLEKKIKDLISLFRRLLVSFLVEFCSSDSLKPLPPVTSDGRSVDLFSLFLNVSFKGGSDAVSENGLWGEIAQECGLGFNNSESARLIFATYLDSLARWLNRAITTSDTVELLGVSDSLVCRLRDFVSQVKRKYEMRKGNNNTITKELGAELKWFISKTKRRYDKYLIGNDVLKQTQELETETNGCGNKESSPAGKRKRECSLETLKWLSEAAKDPHDPSIGYLPASSKWESFGSEEQWKQLLLFRASRINTDPACDKTWKKLQKMHPSLYEDSAGPSYNLRERLSLSAEKKARTSKESPEDGSASQSSSEEDRRPCSQTGSEYQAEVSEWTDITPESDSKWLGTVTWPLSKELNESNLLIERDPIGKGRQEPCGCHNQGSVECVRFHISKKQEKLKLELGSAFYMWCVDAMGEGALKYWTDLELKKVKCLMTSPPTLSTTFFDQLKSVLSSKSRALIVSYFYNVILLRFRANQSRNTPDEVDSDTDQLYYIATENEDATLEANTPPKQVRLSPKKKRRR
ncbi:unnamed protein product [Cochlearia groenlandica]